MGEIRLPRHMFLWSMSLIYLFAFTSFYVQIPGLYGNEGILDAGWLMRSPGRPLLEQLWDSPTLLWLAPHLGLDTSQMMELISLLGALLSFGALVLEPLRDSLIFFLLWFFYLSLFQVAKVFLYFQWDSLLLETGFLAVLVAPLKLFRGKSSSCYHDGMTFWLLRWLLFRLTFASGVVKLTSRCPTWWGLTALTYHYETQCLPTPLAWYAHQLPVWFHKLSVVGLFVIEMATPFLFFAPIRCLRLTSFYLQVLLQVFIILSGNYSFFNLLTIALCFSLLDDDQMNSWLGRYRKKSREKTWPQALISWTAFMIELAMYVLIIYCTRLYFELEVNWETKSVSSRTAFTYDQFHHFLNKITVSTIWIGVLSLTWEVITAMFRCACVRGLWKLLVTIQWAIFATVAAFMLTISLVPYTTIHHETHRSIWPGVQKLYDVVDRYQLVSSYGLFRTMTGVGGRPEVVIEGSMDKKTWTEIEFMYKPGNESTPLPVVVPHQPRLDWQMWFAAQGPYSQSPWFVSLVHQLLQGSRSVIKLIQVDESRYPFSQQPPAFIRARLYKYWFTKTSENGTSPQRWWRRRYVGEFFPAVCLGDPALENLLSQFDLKDKDPDLSSPEGPVPGALQVLRSCVGPLSGPLVLWSLFATWAAISLMKIFCSPRTSRPRVASTESRSAKASQEKRDQSRKTEESVASQAERLDSDRVPKKRK
ncbi:lipase maturation factor 2-like [Brienomyrus brachyistius]|uniref:lipase maturation factor 2-like n=1 Tax=Brienomyrus brachyistius TaxID=42636 RepID=UPI0020B3ECE9|nr:lipase maturation factor 2-like [Brienomyrus brachyistius]